MKKFAIAVVISLVTGFAVAAYIIGAPKPEPAPALGADPGDYFDQSAAVEDRIRALEAAVAQERNARQLLEDELQILYGEIERMGAAPQSIADDADSVSSRERIAEERMRRTRLRDSGGERVSMLVEEGFSADRADWIVKRESELQMEAMQAQFEARRSGEEFNWRDVRLHPQRALRAEIGDAEYEQYLKAHGSPTSVGIGTVLESSPAQRAGLKPGDRIVSYGGERIFGIWELRELTMQGDPTKTVVVDIIRDDVPMQVVLPQGPIGFSESNGRWRR